MTYKVSGYIFENFKYILVGDDENMEKDFNTSQSYMDFNIPPNGIDMNEIYKDPMFNPIAQYEQAFYYYRYLCMQMDYKIKCKEYEKMCNNPNDRRDRKIE